MFIPSGRKPYRDQSENIYSLYYLMAFGVGGQAEINYELLQGQHRTFDHYRFCKFPCKNMVLPSVESVIIPLTLAKTLNLLILFQNTTKYSISPVHHFPLSHTKRTKRLAAADFPENRNLFLLILSQKNISSYFLSSISFFPFSFRYCFCATFSYSDLTKIIVIHFLFFFLLTFQISFSFHKTPQKKKTTCKNKTQNNSGGQ